MDFGTPPSALALDQPLWLLGNGDQVSQDKLDLVRKGEEEMARSEHVILDVPKRDIRK